MSQQIDIAVDLGVVAAAAENDLPAVRITAREVSRKEPSPRPTKPVFGVHVAEGAEGNDNHFSLGSPNQKGYCQARRC